MVIVSALFFYALGCFALVWLFLILYWLWPTASGARYQPSPLAKPSRRQRANAPKPFTGLTQKPHCALCERDTVQPKPTSAVPPAPILPPHRRPRVVDTSQHCCPHPRCDYWGWLGLSNLRANGHPSGGPWRQFQCVSCQGYFQETHGTPLHGKRVSPDMLIWAVGALAEGLGIRAVARVFEVDPNTVLQGVVEAANQLQAFSQHFLHDVCVTQVQMDEFYALLSAVKDSEVSETEALKCLPRSSQWVWAAIDPVSKLMLTMDVGDRTLAMAQRVVHQVRQVLAPGCLPLFLTDGLKDYATALLTHFGHWVQPPRRQATGPVPKPRWIPLPELRYAQVVKQYRRRRLVSIQHRVVFGTLAGIKQVLATHGWHINTAFIERANGAIRQHVAAIGRRVITLCKGEAGLRRQLALYHIYYNFCLPHAGLRQLLPQPKPTNGNGSPKQWRRCTPAMAAGLTDHIWPLREVLLYRVPPWPQP